MRVRLFLFFSVVHPLNLMDARSERTATTTNFCFLVFAGSDNDSPKIFRDDQLYIILELNNGGEDLESFEFNNAQQTLSVFKQVRAYSFCTLFFQLSCVTISQLSSNLLAPYSSFLFILSFFPIVSHIATVARTVRLSRIV